VVGRKGGRGGAPARPRALVITGDGLNCERETAWAFALAGAEPELVHIGDILRREKRIGDYEILAFIGGFSNGDHLGAGTVQASRFRHGLREELERFIADGRPVIGVCNGFQTLVKMGVLPGLSPWSRAATIMVNDSGRFEDRWVHLLLDPSSPCVWTAGLRRLFLPVRHGEGKFYCPDPSLLAELRRNHQVVARYADSRGRPTQEYPDNPNGSPDAVAAVCNPSGTVFGLMPHPEAYLSPYNHPGWSREVALGRPLPAEGQGVALFRNAVAYLRGAWGKGEG
jgi:phosphoribosylformylglycinamidine synthase I